MPSLAASLLLTSLASSSSAPSSPSSARILLGAPLSSASSQSSSTSSLTVTFSDGSRQPYSHTDALFGIPAYQSGTAGLLYYPLKDEGNTSAPGCAPLTDPGISRRLVLLDRSSPSDDTTCSFTQKVLNAQQAGALGVVVIDSLGLCGDPKDTQCWGSPDCNLCPLAQTPGRCQCALPMMADSGGGSSISIPSMLVSKSDGIQLRKAASDAAALPLASMRWDIPAADGSVTVTMWQDSIDQAASAFRNSWALYVPYLQTSTHFMPHFYVIDGTQFGCNLNPAICTTQCINGGKYCARDPDGDPDSGVSGGDVVLENLRSQCAFLEANATFSSDYAQRWWRYAAGYEAACSDPARWGEACSTQALRAAGYDSSAVARVAACVAASNATAAATAGTASCAAQPFNRPTATCNWTNPLLQRELNLVEEMNIQRLPSLLVEGVVVAGATASPPNVLGAVCMGFGSGATLPGGRIPPVCACGGAAGVDIAACLAGLGGGGGGGGSAPTAMPGWAVAILLLSLLALAGAGGAVWYIRRTRGQVEEMFAEYSSLPDGAEGAAGAGAGAAAAAGEVGSAGSLQGGGGRGFRAAPKFPSSTADMLPSWLGSLLTPPQLHTSSHVRLPTSSSAAEEEGSKVAL